MNKIRKARLLDLFKILRVSDACLSQKETYARCERWLYPFYIISGKVYVYSCDGNVFGYVIKALFNSGFGHLFVLPEMRNYGIGSELIDYIGRRYGKLRCHCRPELLNYYQDRGFKVAYICMEYLQ